MIIFTTIYFYFGYTFDHLTIIENYETLFHTKNVAYDLIWPIKVKFWNRIDNKTFNWVKDHLSKSDFCRFSMQNIMVCIIIFGQFRLIPDIVMFALCLYISVLGLTSPFGNLKLVFKDVSAAPLVVQFEFWIFVQKMRKISTNLIVKVHIFWGGH